MKIALGNLLLDETTVNIHVHSKVDYLKVIMFDIIICRLAQKCEFICTNIHVTKMRYSRTEP